MFDNLISDMDLHYFDKDSEPGNIVRIFDRSRKRNISVVLEPVVGKIYAAQVSSDWHRVKVRMIFGHPAQ